MDEEPGRLTADGPYIIYDEKGDARVISVDLDGNVTDSTGIVPGHFEVTSHDGQFRFDVTLHQTPRQEWFLPKTERTFVLSDPHGRMDCLVSILKAGGVIDDQLRWAFGSDRVVLIGDVMDRGDDVTQIYWLLYKLQQEASELGGSLSFVYGNHEAMVLAGDLRYTRDKYCALADSLGLSVPALYGPDTEIGRWLSATNTIVKLGDDLFVHAGLSKEFADYDLTVPEVNEICSDAVFLTSKQKKAESEQTYKLFKSMGPVWYRGFFMSGKKFGKRIDSATLDGILRQYEARRVFVGHTIFKNPKSFYNGKVIAVDVDAKINSDKGRGRALLLDSSGEYVIRDSGERRAFR